MEITVTIDDNGIYTITGGKYYMQFDSNGLTQGQIERNIQIAEDELRFEADRPRINALIDNDDEIPEEDKQRVKCLVATEEGIAEWKRFHALPLEEKEAEVNRLIKEQGL